MVNKKISKLLGPVAGIMGFMLTVGVLEVPVLADDNVRATTAQATTSSAVSAKLTNDNDSLININKSAEQNGVKVTIEKAIATKHRLKAIVKVENQQPFDKNKRRNSIINLTYGDNNHHGQGTSYDYLDDKTMLITIEQESRDKEEYPEKGDLRLDVVFPKYKVNIGIDADVDFSQSFKNTIEKDISVKIPKYDFTLNKLESDDMGTRITYTEREIDYSKGEKDFTQLAYSAFILKVGDKMYQISPGGSSSSEEGLIKGTYEADAVTYDRIKDEKDISIIPVTCDISWDEIKDIYKDNNDKEKGNTDKVTTNNVSYVKDFEFSDGSKGEIYNIERNDNTVKVYCRGNSEKESLLMASNMLMYYDVEKDKENYSRRYNSSSNMTFYKDSNDDLGYVVEFSNVEKGKTEEVTFDNIIKEIDRYKVEDEIKITK